MRSATALLACLLVAIALLSTHAFAARSMSSTVSCTPTPNPPAPQPARPPLAAKPATVCLNADIKNEFTARVEVLAKAVTFKNNWNIGSERWVEVIEPRIRARLDRYNKKYNLKLTYSIRQLTKGTTVGEGQKWFKYDVTFVVGRCGAYKPQLVAGLRGDLLWKYKSVNGGMPEHYGPTLWLKKSRLASFPYKG